MDTFLSPASLLHRGGLWQTNAVEKQRKPLVSTISLCVCVILRFVRLLGNVRRTDVPVGQTIGM